MAFFRWYADFKYSCTDIKDTERLGRPNEAVTPQNIKQVLKIVTDDCKLTICELHMVNNNWKWSVILHEKLSTKKIFSKYVVKLQYFRKDKYKNCHRKSGKSVLVTNEGATVNTWAGFTMVLQIIYLFNPIFLKNMA